MPLTSYICFVLFTVLFLTLFRKNTDVFSPVRLFIMIWALAIGLTELKLSRFQKTWSSYNWIVLMISLLSMILGFFIVYVINIGKQIKPINEIRQITKDFTFNTNLLFRYTVLLSIAYLVSYIVSALVIGYIPLFTKYPGVARNDWGIFGFGLFVQSFPSIIYLIILYFLITKKALLKKIILSVVFMIVFLTYAFLLQRYYIALAIISTAVTIYYLTNLFRLRNVIFISLIGLAIMFGMTFIRLTGTIANYLYYLSQMKFSIKYAYLTEPYMYIVMNIENFVHAASKIEKFTYGLFSFDFVFAITGLKHVMAEYLALPKFPFLITNNYNTYTMFFVYYWDFGILGITFFPLLFGMIFSFFYYKMRIKPDLNSIAVYSIFVFVIAFSFFVPVLTFLHFVFNFIVIYFITALVTQKSKIN